MTPETMEKAKQWAMEFLPLKRESCGLVIVEKGKEVFVPCKNLSELDDQFILDPFDYVRAESQGEIVRIIHSHVYIPPKPSEADKVACEASGLPWSIISIPNGDWFHLEPAGYKAPLVGREWAHGLLDCYSIIKDYYKDVVGIEIPDFHRDFEWWEKGQDLYSENFAKAGFYEVPHSEIRRHDVLLMQIGSKVINHGAIYLGDEKILHHLHRRLSGRDVFGGYFKKHTIKVLRHKDA
jgi:proteasome lid subunit RPN8/RPN11